jgi:hypothetical protein
MSSWRRFARKAIPALCGGGGLRPSCTIERWFSGRDPEHRHPL